MHEPVILGVSGAIVVRGSLLATATIHVPENTCGGLKELTSEYRLKQAQLQKLATLGAAMQLGAPLWQAAR